MAQDPFAWNQNDAIALRKFIGDNPKFLINLGRKRPKIEGTTMEARAVTGSDANGFLAALEAIDTMQRDPQQGTANADFIEKDPS